MNKFLHKYSYILLFAVSFIIYLQTLAPGVIQIDSGELATVQALLGIAHPTGYPLFSITGYLFSLLPISKSVIYQLNILAALWCALGAAVFSLTVKLILENLKSFEIVFIKKETKKRKKTKETQLTHKEIPPLSSITIIFAVITSTLLLALSKTYWFQSTSVEVYSLHVFLIITTIYFLIRAFILSENDSSIKHWLYFSIALALSFSNHMTTLLILPGTAYLFFLRYGFNKNSFLRIGKMISLFIPLLIAIYSYLPIRAAQNPVLNWGNPIDWERIMRHISGKQYQVWLFSSSEAAKKQFNYFFSTIDNEFTVGLLLIIIGLIALLIKQRKLFWFILINFAACLFYSINYDISDIDAYFLLAYVSLAMFSAFGAVRIIQWLHDKKLNISLPVALSAVIIFIHTYVTYGEVDQSKVYTFEDYSKEALKQCEENSIIFSYQWDFLISPSYYFQFVENYRKDVCIIDKELLRRSWYYNQLDNLYPEVLKNIKPTVNQFLLALKPFEREENYDAQLLETLYRKIMHDLILENADKVSFYIAPEIFVKEIQQGEVPIPQGYQLVPDLFFFRVVKSNEYIPLKSLDFNIRMGEKRNYYNDQIEKFICTMLVRRTMYEMQFDNRENAKAIIQKIRNDFPNYVIDKGLAEVVEK